MRKVNLLRSVLAAGLAVSLAAAPVSAFAQSTDEIAQIAAVPSELTASVEFGDGLYNLMAGSGQDLTWLKNASCDVKVVPGEEMLDGVLSVSLNDTQLAHMLFSADLAARMAYISIPEYFDQTIAFKPEELLDSLSAGGGSGESSMQNQIIQVLMGGGAKIAEGLKEYFTSLPAEVWQQEMTNYLMPVMSNLSQESADETITVGSLSADVQKQIFSIPPEKMPGMIKGILDALAEDQVIGGLLESDAVSDLCSILMMVSGGTIMLSGKDLKEQFQSSVRNLAGQDYSSVPGVSVTILSSADQKRAMGMDFALNAGGQSYSLCSFKAIMDGSENAFEIVPGQMLLASDGVNGELLVQGHGSTADGKLNEEVDVTMDGQSVGKLKISDLDLASLTTTGRLSGTIHLEAGGVSADVVYAWEDDNTETIEYIVNGERFYLARLHEGPAEDGEIEAIDMSNVVEGASIEDLNKWIGTFKADEARRLLIEAGVPEQMLNSQNPAA